jgi:cyclic pyranopterin monophosphate synthase
MTWKGPGSDGKGEGKSIDDPRWERRRASQFGRSARPRMSNLSETTPGIRQAVAEADVTVSQETLSAIIDGTVPRGEVLSVAELAGVMAAKRTAELIPLVHATPLTELLVVATPDRAAGAVRIRAETAATAAAGVEMEAMTAAAVAALTLYDMIRDVDPGAELRGVRLLSSSGGDSGEWTRGAGPVHAAKPRAARMAGRIGSGSHTDHAPKAPGRRGPRP